MIELPGYGLRAYALFYSKFGSTQPFSQSCLDWLVSTPMKKKIFSLLLRAGWVKKASRMEYVCVSPEMAIKGLLDLRVLEILKSAKLPYALSGASAIELWSDYAYVQRGVERSPYFLRVLRKDLSKWKKFFNVHSIPCYVKNGTTIGEFVVLLPVDKLAYVEKDGFKVDSLKSVVTQAQANYLYAYPLKYIKKKYGV